MPLVFAQEIVESNDWEWTTHPLVVLVASVGFMVLGWGIKRVVDGQKSQDTKLDELSGEISNLDHRLTSHMAVEEIEAKARIATLEAMSNQIHSLEGHVESGLGEIHRRIDEILTRVSK